MKNQELGMCSVVEDLLSMCKTLGLILITKNREGREGREGTFQSSQDFRDANDLYTLSSITRPETWILLHFH